jgi:hypothetical protein
MDGFLGVICFQEEELGDDGGGHGFVDFAVQTDDTFLVFLVTCIPQACRMEFFSYLEQPGKDVVYVE